jgi:sulfonate transport system substrate-binding protein
LLNRRALLCFGLAAFAAAAMLHSPAAAAPSEIRVDFATYNPVSLVLKERKILEKAFEKDGISIRWVQSLGSNKALEFLNASSIDFGSTAGAAALIAKINGNRVAVTRGTDPHIFLVRALAEAGLTEKDVKLVLLQHADGRLALERGDVDAWAGLDPMMASAEIEGGAVLFYRKPEANTWGILNVRESFAQENPEIVKRVLAAYEEARAWALANPDELKKIFIGLTKLPDSVVERQLATRTELTHSAIGAPQRDSILAAGLALQQAGVLPSDADVKAAVDKLIDPSYLAAK